MNDHDLQERFDALRERDRARAPSFARTLAAARNRRERRDNLWGWGALAAAVPAIALVVLAVGALSGGGLAPLPDMTGLEDWVAPSDQLIADAPLPDVLDALDAFSSPTGDFLALDADLMENAQ